jgi:hypothetical protein
VIWVFELSVGLKTLGIVILVGLLIGMLQEGLQLLVGVQVLRWNTLLDLGVDFLGVLIGFGIVTGIKNGAWIRNPRTVKDQ